MLGLKDTLSPPFSLPWIHTPPFFLLVFIFIKKSSWTRLSGGVGGGVVCYIYSRYRVNNGPCKVLGPFGVRGREGVVAAPHTLYD